MLDNKGWQAELRKKDSSVLGKCRFPRETDILIHGNRDQVTISLTADGLYGNMQTDEAAFEAWALALLCHCGVKKVAIELQQGLEKPKGLQEQHFERFLYRLTRFAELFRDQIIVDPTLAKSARALNGDHILFLNQPFQHRRELAAELEERLSKLFGESGGHSESVLEKALEVSPAFRKMLGLEKLMRQWPVGLFKERVAGGENRIFTGNKSAVDLIGIRGAELVLVELKKRGNCKAGAISELLFYASLMRDALKKRFQFEDRRLPRKNCEVTRTDILSCSSISAVLLAPDFHPLIRNPEIIARLNAALDSYWSDLPVQLDVVRIDSIPSNRSQDFSFSSAQRA